MAFKMKGAPFKQVTAGEFAHQKHQKDMETGKATYPIDKVKAAFTAMTSDNITYPEAKKQYRAERKKEYEAKNPTAPAKLKDACYHKVKARYKVFPSAYASGAIAACRKKGAANWGNKSKK